MSALVDMPIGALVSYPGNARVHNEAALDESVTANGQYRAIVVRPLPDGTHQILAGHGTRNALVRSGAQTVRVEVIEADDEAARRIVLADNRTSELASYDDALLAGLLDAASLDGGLLGTGYTGDDYRALLEAVAASEASLAGLTDAEADALDDQDVEPPAEPVTRAGDVWLLGRHRILCGDCREPGVIERLMDGARANVAFTSPPYASQRKYDESSGFKPIRPDEYVDWFDDVQAAVRSVLADDGSWFVNIKEHAQDGQRHLYVKDLTITHVRQWGWRFVDELLWHKPDPLPGDWDNRFKNGFEPILHFSQSRMIRFRPDAVAIEGGRSFTYDQGNVDGSPSGNVGLDVRGGSGTRPGLTRPSNVLTMSVRLNVNGLSHAAVFPTALPQWFVKAYSDPGDAILDPFMGSGTTLIAAHIEDRTAYGTEISPGYVDVICRRYQQATGELPVLESTGEPHDFLADR